MNEKSITTITLKKINKKSVYQYIYEHRQTAKQQIVQDLTMGLSTVSQNLNVLEKEGLISRDGFFESTGGRKAQVIQIVPEYRIAVGVGILKNMFHLAAVNLYGEAIAEETVAVPFAQSDAYYDGIASSLESFLDRNGYDREKILGVSIATRGNPGAGRGVGALRRDSPQYGYEACRFFHKDSVSVPPRARFESGGVPGTVESPGD